MGLRRGRKEKERKMAAAAAAAGLASLILIFLVQSSHLGGTQPVPAQLRLAVP
jgi:hypothetical protein